MNIETEETNLKMEDESKSVSALFTLIMAIKGIMKFFIELNKHSKV